MTRENIFNWSIHAEKQQKLERCNILIIMVLMAISFWKVSVGLYTGNVLGPVSKMATNEMPLKINYIYFVIILIVNS